MRKLLARSPVENPPRRRPARFRWTVLAMLLIALAAPLAWDEARLCQVNWQLILGGRSQTVATPNLDAARELVFGTLDLGRTQIDSLCSRLPWEPVMVIVFSVSIAVFMSVPLRRP